MSNTVAAAPSEPEFAALAAIDWADKKNFWRLLTAGSRQSEAGELDSTPEAVEVWAANLQQRFGGRPIAVILEHHRLIELDEILTEYGNVVDAHAGAVEARITSSRPLNHEDRAQLEAQVAKLAGANVRASYVEDASLLGGAVVEIGSTIYDGSVRAQLQQLKQRLVNA